MKVWLQKHLIKIKRMGTLSQWGAEITYCAAYGALGLVLGAYGPVLLQLASNVGVDIEDGNHNINNWATISNIKYNYSGGNHIDSNDTGHINGGHGAAAKLGSIFTARGSGWLIGSIAGGPLLDYTGRRGHWVLSGAVMLVGIMFTVVPFVSVLWLLLASAALHGFGCGILDTMCNTLTVWLWGAQDASPFVQAVHFAMGIGGFLAPFIVALGTEIRSDSIAIAFCVMGGFSLSASILPLMFPTPLSPKKTQLNNYQDSNVIDAKENEHEHEIQENDNIQYENDDNNHNNNNNNNNNTTPNSNELSNVNSTENSQEIEMKQNLEDFQENNENSYDSNNDSDDNNNNTSIDTVDNDIILETEKSTSNQINESQFFKHTWKHKLLTCIVIFFGSLFLFLYVGAEVGFAGWIASYAIQMDLLAEQGAAILTSGFWGALTVGRLVAVPVSIKLAEPWMILMCMGICGVSVIFILALSSHLWALWIGTLFFGFGMAPIYPTGITLPSYFGVSMSGRATSVMIVGAALGELVIPFIIAPLFQEFGATSIMWAMLGVVILATINSVMLFSVGKIYYKFKKIQLIEKHQKL